jgi:hypothetical protein
LGGFAHKISLRKSLSVPRADGYDQLLALWGIQESLLQTYRAVFITVESVLFGIAVAAVKDDPVAGLLLTGLGLFVVWMWNRVCSSRAKDVSFVQWMLEQTENGVPVPKPFLCLRRFQAGDTITIGARTVSRHRDSPKLTTDKPYATAYGLMSLTRARPLLETYLPIVFLILWLLIVWRARHGG